MYVCLLIILLAAIQCDCREDEILTIIYAQGGQVFVKNTSGHEVFEELKKFDGNVTSLSVYNDYLYISVKRSKMEHSAIWRVKIVNLTNLQVDERTWNKFNKMHTVKDILSMVIVNGTIFAGRTDGVMWRCSTDLENSCENFNVFNEETMVPSITEIDYNSIDDQLYASVKSESLLLTNHTRRVNDLKYCSPYHANSCSVATLMYNQVVSAVKVAFNTVWLGSKEAHLWKCPLDRKNEISIDKTCIKYKKLDPSGSVNFVASDKYLYVHVESDKYIWRCDPQKVGSCSKVIKANEDFTGPYIVFEQI